MKKLVLLALILTVAVGSSFGQDFKKFKVGIGIGYGQPSDGSGGVLIYLEPAYRVMDPGCVSRQRPFSTSPYPELSLPPVPLVWVRIQ